MGRSLFWTFTKCRKSAKAHYSRSIWFKQCPAAYLSANRNGWLEECCAHMVRLRSKKISWTKEKCSIIARKYASRAEWSRRHNRTYRYACRKGWLEDCAPHLPPMRRKMMSIKECRKDVVRFSSRKEWRESSPRSYHAAKKHGILNDFFKEDKWHRCHYAKWNPKKIVKFARKFKTRTEWRAKSWSTYNAAKLNNCFDQCCAHMG